MTDPAHQEPQPDGPAATPASGSAKSPGGKAKHLTQMYLDVGQRDFHSKRCPTCGMVYTPGDQGDERLHASFHSNATRGLRYTVAPTDRAVAVDGTRGTVVLVDAGAKGKRVGTSLLRFLDPMLAAW